MFKITYKKVALPGPITKAVLVFMIFIPSFYFLMHAAAQQGDITGVVVESRADEDGDQTLLVEVRGDENARADDVRLKIPKNDAKKIKKTPTGFFPSGWGMTMDEGYLKMSGAGMKLPLHFRIDLGKISAPYKTDVEIYHQGKKKFTKKGVIITKRPPVRISDDFSSLVKFPPVISPGGWVTFKPLDVKKTPPGGTWKVGGEPAEFVEEKQYYKFTLPEKMSLSASISLSYTDPYDVDLYYTGKYPDIRITAYPDLSAPSITGVSEMVLVGDLVCICGYFPDESSRSGFRIDGRDLGAPVSASTNVVVVRLPEDIQPGRHRITADPYAGFDGNTGHEIEVIRVGGSIDRNKLLRGDSTPLRLRVEGTEKVIHLKLTNTTPQIVTLDGGNEQELATTGGAENKIEKTVHAVSPGDFHITYKLDLSFCPCYESTLKDGGGEETEFFENLYDDVFNDFRNGRDAANEAANRRWDEPETAKLKAREALELFSRARKKLEQGIENGDIGPTTAESFRKFISEYESQAQKVLDMPDEEELVIDTEEPVSSRPEEKPHAVVTDGWLSPSQGVWQDDDVFKDFSGKQLTKTGPGQWNAELKMVVNRPTLIFGIREDGWNRIKMMGTTNGTRLTKVKFRFKLKQGGTEKVLYTEPEAHNFVALDGPVGPEQPWAASIMADRGLPEYRSFTIDNAGSYSIEAELLREDGSGTGLKISVSGETIQTYGPTVRIVPAILGSSNPAGWNGTLTGKAQALASTGENQIPLFYPLAPGGMTVSAEPLQDLKRLEPGTLSKLKSLLPFTDTTEEVRADALSAAMAQQFGTDASMTGGPKIMVLLSDHDFDLTRRGGTAAAYTASQKFMVGRHDINFESLAHELVHSMPYLWSVDQMVQNFGLNYHNSADNQYGNGVEIHQYYRVMRKHIHAVMGSAYIGKWITQGTYWHLLGEFRSRPDPELLLLRGYIAREGRKAAGYFIPFYQTMGIADLEALDDAKKSEWAVVVKNKAGSELARYPIYARWRVPDLDVERKILSFTHRVPFTTDIYRLELMGPTGLLESREISANAPSIKITSPTPDGSVTPVNKEIQIRWSGADPDNDPLVYSVYYSPDNGKKWRLVAMDKKANSLALAIPGNPKKVRVKVVATDGIRSASDEITFYIK